MGRDGKSAQQEQGNCQETKSLIEAFFQEASLRSLPSFQMFCVAA